MNTLLSASRTPLSPLRLRLIGAAALALVVALPSVSDAQSRGRAVPRGGSIRGGGPGRVVVQPRTVYRSYRPVVNRGFFYGYPGYYGGFGYGYPYAGFGPGAGFGMGYGAWGQQWGNGWNAPYGYGYSGYAGRPYGGVRIDLPQRDAEVFVDGYFVGTVDNFDGRLQQANLEAGPHRIEVRDPNFDPITFDVNVEPGRTITYRGGMRPLRP